MSKMKTVLMALVAVLAIGALGATGASAAKFKVKAPNTFPVEFTATGGPGTLETETGGVPSGGRAVSCKASSGKGEVASETSVAKLTVTFTGCFAEKQESLSCGTVTAASGTITTNAIKGEAVDINSGLTEAGVLLSPEVAGTLFAKFTCADPTGVLVNNKLSVKGSIIGKVTLLSTFSTKLHLEFTETGGKPTYTNYFGTPHGTASILTEGVESGLLGKSFAYEGSGIQEAKPGETETTSTKGQEVELEP